MNPKDYTNHSGGAKGADMMWDEIGRKYGVTNHIHWRPEHLNNMTLEGRSEMLDCFMRSAIALERPIVFRGVELCQRNWFQVHHSEAIYAVSYIISPGEVDFKGFENKTGKEIVFGGTGWAVEMAIQMGKPVHVYNMGDNSWYWWQDDAQEFREIPTPDLTTSFAGIGSKLLTPEGIQAIKNVYIKTFNHVKEGKEKEKEVL